MNRDLISMAHPRETKASQMGGEGSAELLQEFLRKQDETIRRLDQIEQYLRLQSGAELQL